MKIFAVTPTPTKFSVSFEPLTPALAPVPFTERGLSFLLASNV
jgi:hypothetical protein